MITFGVGFVCGFIVGSVVVALALYFLESIFPRGPQGH